MTKDQAMLEPPSGKAAGDDAQGSHTTSSPASSTTALKETSSVRARRPAATDRSPRRRLWISVATRAAVVLVILFIALSITGALIATKPQVGQTAVPEIVRSVRVIELAEVPVSRRWDGYGTVRPLDVSEVASEVAGRVATRPAHIEPGVRVREGDLIVALEAADFASRLESAEQTIAALEAQLASFDVQERRTLEQIDRSEDEIALATSELDRVRESVQLSAASQIEADRLEQSLARLRRELAGLSSAVEQLPLRRAELRANIGAQRTNAETARRDLERARITSPIDGVIQRVDVRVGEFVPTGGVVARVVSLERLEVPLRIPASSVATLRPGLAVTLRPVGPSAETYEGVISRIAPESDASRRDITVFVEITQNPEAIYEILAPSRESDRPARADAAAQAAGLLLPGRFVMGTVLSPETSRRLIIPRKALNQDRLLVARAVPGSGDAENNGPLLRAVAVNTTVLYYVDGLYPTLDAVETQWAVVQGGLQPGDSVIISNLDELAPGMRVQVRDDSAPSTQPRATSTPGGAD